MDKFLPGDSVDYIGSKVFEDDSGEPLNLFGKVGTVVARINGCENGYSVEFGPHGFVMGGHVLKRHKFTQKELERERNTVKVRRTMFDED